MYSWSLFSYFVPLKLKLQVIVTMYDISLFYMKNQGQKKYSVVIYAFITFVGSDI